LLRSSGSQLPKLETLSNLRLSGSSFFSNFISPVYLGFLKKKKVKCQNILRFLKKTSDSGFLEKFQNSGWFCWKKPAHVQETFFESPQFFEPWLRVKRPVLWCCGSSSQGRTHQVFEFGGLGASQKIHYALL
jgi:hypothetical protein